MTILEALRQTATSIKTWADNKFLNKNDLKYPVDSVNGKTGAVVLDASDIGALSGDTVIPSTADDFGIYVQAIEPTDAVAGDIWIDTANDPYYMEVEMPTALPNPSALVFSGAVTGTYNGSRAVEIKIPNAPSKTSELTNDSGFITDYTETDPTVPSWAKQSSKPTYTAAEVGAEPAGISKTKVDTHNIDTTSHNDMRLEIQALNDGLNAFLSCDQTTRDKLAELIVDIQSNQDTIEALTSGKINISDIADNLTTNIATKPLSAAQGVVLKKLVDDIVVPTKVSQLTNDSGYITSVPVTSVNGLTGAVKITTDSIGAQPAGNYALKSELGTMAAKSTVAKADLASDVQTSLNKANSALQSYTETDPTVPAWAKAASKPSYSKSEVGLGNVDNVRQYSVNNPPPYPVISVNKKTGAISLTPADIGADSAGTASSLVSAHNTSTDAHTDIRNALNTKQAKGDYALRSELPTKVSQLTNDKGYLTGYTETDPTVPAWAKAASKPTYSKSEVGLGNVDNVKQYSASNPPPYPVTSVNGKTGAVTISALPAVTTADNGKVLMVVNGQWQVVKMNVKTDANGVLYI